MPSRPPKRCTRRRARASRAERRGRAATRIFAVLRALSGALIVLFVLLHASSARADADAGAPKQTDAGADEDIVETFDDDGGSTTTIGPAEPTVPQAEQKKEETPIDKIDFRGFARFTVGAGLFAQRASPGSADPVENVGYDRGFAETHGYFDLRYSRGKVFQAVISGSLAYAAYLTEFRPGSTEPARAADFSFFEPTLREAYVGIFTDRVDIRLGQQRIVWGNSDSIAPNDILNARDLRDRLQLDPEMVHYPTLAARADIDLGFATLGLVAQPFFVPDKFSLYGTNWSLVQPDAPEAYRRLFGLYAQGRDRALVQDVQDILADAQTPRVFPDGASAGGSLSMTVGKVDTAYYYEYGYDRSPYTYLDPQLLTQLQSVDPNQVNGAVLDAFLQQLKTANAAYGGPLVLKYLRRHHVGADAATTAGPFVIRVDGAYDSSQNFTSAATLNSVAKPVAQGVFGVEYQTGDFNKIVILEAWYEHILGPKIPIVPVANQANFDPLLFVGDDNVGFSNLIRWTFDENIIFEMRSFVGVTSPFWYTLRPEIGYGTPSFTARVGVMVIDGDQRSFGWYFRRNDTAYITTRYAF